jgi:hypothetical protein
MTLADVQRRRDRRHRVRRVEAGVVGLAFAVASIGAASLALRAHTTAPAVGGGANAGLPPATVTPLETDIGQYYVWKVSELAEGCFDAEGGTCGFPGLRLEVTYWWSPDGSGRIKVDESKGYGIEGGLFEKGRFPNPNGIDVSSFPLAPGTLAAFLLERSAEDGASPAPLVTPPPDGAPRDGQLWRAITDLLTDPHMTPAVRAALLDVAAGLQGSRVETGVIDPVGRPADVIRFANWAGDQPEALYVDPTNHELLAWTATSRLDDRSFQVFVVRDAGVVNSTDATPDPGTHSIPPYERPLPKTAAEVRGAQGA